MAEIQQTHQLRLVVYTFYTLSEEFHTSQVVVWDFSHEPHIFMAEKNLGFTGVISSYKWSDMEH